MCHGCQLQFHTVCFKTTTGRELPTEPPQLSWFCGMCTSSDPHTLGLTSLGRDHRLDRYWFVGGHAFREDHATGEFFQVVQAEVEGWQAVRRGNVAEQQLAQSFRDIAPKLCHKKLSETLCNAFYVEQQYVDPVDDSTCSDEDLDESLHEQRGSGHGGDESGNKQAMEVGESQRTVADGDKAAEPDQNGAAAAALALSKSLKPCEMCGAIHDGAYGSGRFCTRACAARFSTQESRTPAQVSQEAAEPVDTKPPRVCGVLFNPTGYENRFHQALEAYPPGLSRRFELTDSKINNWPLTQPHHPREELLSTLRHVRNVMIRIEARIAHVFKQAKFRNVREQKYQTV